MATRKQVIDPTFVGTPAQIEVLRKVIDDRSGTHSKETKRELRQRVRASMSCRPMSHVEDVVDGVVENWRAGKAHDAEDRPWQLGDGGWLRGAQ